MTADSVEMRRIELPMWAKLIPTCIAFVIVIGNIFPALPIWGFNYFVLQIPYGSEAEWVSNCFIVAVGLFPFFKDNRWIGEGYIIIGIIATSILTFYLAIMVAGQFVDFTVSQQKTFSIFSTRSTRILLTTLFVGYLLYSLLLSPFSRHPIFSIALGMFSTASTAAYYIVDLANYYQQ